MATAAVLPPGLDALRTLRRAPLAGRPEPDLFARLEPMSAHLVGVPLLCYLPRDLAALTNPAANPVAATRASRELFLAQRVFAPTHVRLLGVDPSVAWTLGNFENANAIPSDWRQRGLDLVADHGNGVVLFKPRGR